MSRYIRRVGLVAALGVVTGCGLLQAINNWLTGREQGTSCMFQGTQLAQAVGINGFINASLPCPTVLYGTSPRSVGFNGSIVANASAVWPNVSYALKNRLGATVFTASQTGFINGSQRVWQPNYTITIGTGGVSGIQAQNVDTLFGNGNATSGSPYTFWAAVQYRPSTTPGMSIQWNGTAWENVNLLVSANLQDPNLTAPIAYDWALDGSSTSFNTGSNQLTVPGGAAGTWRNVRVTATGANGRQAIGNETVYFQACTAECNQFKISRASPAEANGNH